MGTKTGISWTDATWNPIRGCSRVSEGCRNCYAERRAYRFSGPGLPYEGLVQLAPDHIAGEYDPPRLPKWNGTIRFVEEHLLDPLRWKKPRRIFVNSMSDLFHENVTDQMRDEIFAVMALCPQHTFQVLTKRPERQKEYLSKEGVRLRIHQLACGMYPVGVGRRIQWVSPISMGGWPLPNVHLGVSVEDQKTADQRIPLLLQTPAAIRFISAEPLLRPLDLREFLDGHEEAGIAGNCVGWIPPLDWVIAGGESGPGARPMHPDWARSLRDQCKSAGVPFFFKQWGAWTPGENVEATSGVVQTADWFGGNWSFDKENLANDEGHVDDQPDVYRVGAKAAGCLLDGVEHHEFPAVVS